MLTFIFKWTILGSLQSQVLEFVLLQRGCGLNINVSSFRIPFYGYYFVFTIFTIRADKLL